MTITEEQEVQDGTFQMIVVIDGQIFFSRNFLVCVLEIIL